MTRKYFISAGFIMFLVVVTITGKGQDYVVAGENLVPNSSFEETRACPKDADYIGGVVSWNLFPNFSADYFHRCANVYRTLEYIRKFPYEEIQNFSVPQSMFGYQEAHTGDAYAGISFCYEALSVKLTRPLEADSLYRVEFFVSLSDSSNVGTRYFGMYFSEIAIRASMNNQMQISNFLLDCPPQIQNPSGYFLTDTANWTSINGIYKAKGGEQYIAIGGFYPYHDSLVQTIRSYRPLAKVYRSNEKQLGYYFVDDVSVVPYREVWAPKAGETHILENIYFEFDKAELLPESYHELNQLLVHLEAHPEYHIVITGHTDNLGTETYNLTLSRNRAKAVADYLTDNGLEKSRVTYDGQGTKQPITDNDTEEGRSRNRRVEFILKESGAQDQPM